MALVPAGYLKAVVALGVSEEGDFVHKGTGFLYSHPVWREGDRTQYHTFLVTNKHVLDSGVSDVRFNRIDDERLETRSIASVASRGWAVHPSADVATIPVSSPGLLMDGRDLVKPEVFLGDVGTPSDEEKRHIVEGNGVFVLGFPLGLVGMARNYPIVRQGIIARIQDWLRRDEGTFLIDSAAFPGNSGGPVILKPEPVAVRGTQATTHALLIGMIRSYIPYRDVAVSSQTGKARIIFEENSGLAEVVPVDVIKETITLAMSEIGPSGFKWTETPRREWRHQVADDGQRSARGWSDACAVSRRGGPPTVGCWTLASVELLRTAVAAWDVVAWSGAASRKAEVRRGGGSR